METNKETKNTEQQTGQPILKKIDHLFRSKCFKWGVITLSVFVVLALVFNLGTMVGYRKADFSFKWGENYHKNFGGPKNGFMGGPMPEPMSSMMGEDFINSHGASGQIIKMDENNLIIRGSDNVERTILISSKTVIRSGRQDIKIADLKVGEMTVIIGQPDDQGKIAAQLIRVFP